MRYLFLIILISGCLAQESCQDLLIRPVNKTMDQPDLLDCIAQHELSDCTQFSGAARLSCLAISENDLSRCDAIPSEYIMQRCKAIVRDRIGYTPIPSNCSNLTGQALRWCLIYEAKTEAECLSIDESIYPDEARFCFARLYADEALCNPISDKIIKNLCKNTIKDNKT